MIAVALLLTLSPAKPVPKVLLFVLADCPIARKYAPELKRLEKEYAKKARFEIVHVDPHTDKAAAVQYAKDFGYQAPFVLDPGQRLAKKAGVTNVPTAAIYEGETVRYLGRIDNRFPDLGVQKSPTRRDLKIALDEVLAGKPVSVKRTTVVGCVLPTL